MRHENSTGYRLARRWSEPLNSRLGGCSDAQRRRAACRWQASVESVKGRGGFVPRQAGGDVRPWDRDHPGGGQDSILKIAVNIGVGCLCTRLGAHGRDCMHEVELVMVFFDVVRGVLRLGKLRMDRTAVDAGIVMMAMQRGANDVGHQQQDQRPTEELRQPTPQAQRQAGVRRGALGWAKGKSHG